MADPGERSLDDPAFGKHGEAMQFIALDDRQLPGAGLGDGGRGLLPPVPGISEDKLDEGEEAACAPIEDEQSAVAILHSGRVDDDVQQQAERVDQDMPFAAGSGDDFVWVGGPGEGKLRIRGRCTVPLPPSKPILPFVVPQRWPPLPPPRLCGAPASCCAFSRSSRSTAPIPAVSTAP